MGNSIEFYHLPSAIVEDFDITSTGNADITHSIEEPLTIYKNIYIGKESDSINVTISSGKMLLINQSSINIGDLVNLDVTDEFFEFNCGSSLVIKSTKESDKLFENCTFDATGANYNMINVLGNHSGGEGSGTASSSLEFIGCTFIKYYGKAVTIKESRASFINADFNPEFDNKTDSLTSAAIFLEPSSRIDVRGSIFENNDIAIDATDSEVYIGHPSKKFKDREVSIPTFQNNVIAYHSKGSYLRSENSIYQDNIAGIIDLNGVVDIEKNSGNEFNRNEKAIIISNEFLAEKGRNIFADNSTDVSVLYPELVNESVTFDATCNFWIHEDEENSPIFEYIYPSSTSFEIVIESVPFLTRRINGSGKPVYTCSRGQIDKDSTEIIRVKGKNKISKKSIATSQKIKDKKYKEALTEMSSALDFSFDKMALGRYESDVLTAYYQATNKNLGLTYLMAITGDQEISRSDNLLQSVFSESSSRNIHPNIQITLDRLAFLEIIQSKITSIEQFSTEPISILTVYPNPFASQIELEVKPEMNGQYSCDIYNLQGSLVKNVFENRNIDQRTKIEVDLSNLGNDIYILTIRRGNQVVDSKKIIKIN